MSKLINGPSKDHPPRRRGPYNQVLQATNLDIAETDSSSMSSASYVPSITCFDNTNNGSRKRKDENEFARTIYVRSCVQ